MQKISNLSFILSDLHAIYLFPGGFENPMCCLISNPLNNSYTYTIPTTYLPHTIPTPFLPHTYPIPTHTYNLLNFSQLFSTFLNFAQLTRLCTNFVLVF